MKNNYVVIGYDINNVLESDNKYWKYFNSFKKANEYLHSQECRFNCLMGILDNWNVYADFIAKGNELGFISMAIDRLDKNGYIIENECGDTYEEFLEYKNNDCNGKAYIRVETNFGTLYLLNCGDREIELCDSNFVVFATISNEHETYEGIIKQLMFAETWNDFVIAMENEVECFMWSKNLRALQYNFYSYQKETYPTSHLTLRECQKIVRENHLIIGNHYCFANFIDF